jgi:hypothetical protein
VGYSWRIYYPSYVFLHKYKKDNDIHRAYWLTFWAAFVTWTVCILIVILVIVCIAFPEISVVLLSGASLLSLIALILFGVLVLVSGCLSAAAAYYINQSPYIDNDPPIPHIQTAYKWTIIGACICLGGFVLLNTFAIIFWAVKRRDRKNKEKRIQEGKKYSAQQQRIKQQKIAEAREREKADDRERLKNEVELAKIRSLAPPPRPERPELDMNSLKYLNTDKPEMSSLALPPRPERP